MRHIPEAELHAYLDQALSRSQCVEIESHLAECGACQTARDDIAALRDRTTALLGRLAPANQVVPSFELLRHRSEVQHLARRRRMQRAAWAASIIGGIALGWGAATLFRSGSTRGVARADHGPAEVVVVPHSPTIDSATALRQRGLAKVVASRPAPADVQPRSAAAPHQDTVTAEAPSAVATAPKSTASDSTRRGRDVLYDSVWRTVSLDGARTVAGGQTPPHIDGLPVVNVQVQKSEDGKRSTMVVAQQLASGEVIRTIEGPANDVSRLLGRRVMTDLPKPSAPSARGGARPSAGAPYANQTYTVTQGGRILAITAALPSDSLRAMINRMNAELQRK